VLGGAKKNRKARPEPQSWHQDRYQLALVQRKGLYFITILSLLSTLFMAIIGTQLMPLKSIEPYVIQIDSKTGRTETINPLSASELTANQVVNNYFLVQYIRAREGYAAADIVYNYSSVVRLMSEARVYKNFMKWADPNNPTSNIARLGTVGTRTVKIKSITYLSPHVAQIRFSISERSANAPLPVESNYIALISFEYGMMNLTAEERYTNPLGFHITDYQLNEDTPS